MGSKVIQKMILMQTTIIILKLEMEKILKKFFLKLIKEGSMITLECINLMEQRFLNMIWDIVVRMCREILNIHGNGLIRTALRHLNM